ncbi:MAG: hypothetical protein CL678_11465 [Bdellovibrionaceae bacterium]|nr:hypothetical protein [Pseudobdellovibrionaceae bacterium]|tara:strand:+ start:5717 stop:6406 length:690 start_codon:yes stop_codon:yes gene_type:complete
MFFLRKSLLSVLFGLLSTFAIAVDEPSDGDKDCSVVFIDDFLKEREGEVVETIEKWLNDIPPPRRDLVQAALDKVENEEKEKKTRLKDPLFQKEREKHIQFVRKVNLLVKRKQKGVGFTKEETEELAYFFASYLLFRHRYATERMGSSFYSEFFKNRKNWNYVFSDPSIQLSYKAAEALLMMSGDADLLQADFYIKISIEEVKSLSVEVVDHLIENEFIFLKRHLKVLE